MESAALIEKINQAGGEVPVLLGLLSNNRAFAAYENGSVKIWALEENEAGEVKITQKSPSESSLKFSKEDIGTSPAATPPSETIATEQPPK